MQILNSFEQNLLNQLDLNLEDKILFVGVDEVGRGPLAGPVVASAVGLILKRDLKLSANILTEISDSKKLTSKKRQKILSELGINDFKSTQKAALVELNNGAVSFKALMSLGEVSSQEIDERNILRASHLAMLRAIEKVWSGFQCPSLVVILVDGPVKISDLKNECEWSKNFIQIPIIKGDTLSTLIGLASIYAKEVRDQMMNDYHEIYPQYGFSKHAGYPSQSHREALKKFGPTPWHRVTFKGVIDESRGRA